MFFSPAVFLSTPFVVERKSTWLLFRSSSSSFVEELTLLLAASADRDLVIIFEVFHVVGLAISLVELFLSVFRNYHMYKRNSEAPVTKRGEFTDEDETKCVINEARDKWKGIRCTSGHYRAQSLQEVFSAEKPEATKELRSPWITGELV